MQADTQKILLWEMPWKDQEIEHGGKMLALSCIEGLTPEEKPRTWRISVEAWQAVVAYKKVSCWAGRAQLWYLTHLCSVGYQEQPGGADPRHELRRTQRCGGWRLLANNPLCDS